MRRVASSRWPGRAEHPRRDPRPAAMTRVLILTLLAVMAAACSSAAGESPAATAGEGPTIPIACLGLEEPDCTRAFEAAVDELAPDDEVIYAEVGPFSCPNEAGCPNTLPSRPVGQVVFERSNDAPVLVSVSPAADGTMATSPGDFFGIAVAPSSTAGQLATDPIPYSLGHCGLMSGVDVDGSWWDPVGFVDIDDPDAINSANGTFAPSDPNHATFTSDGGFSVSVVRRVGQKYLPGCM
jgi:hypothetical protein